MAVEFDGPPVAVVADQQGALLQAALAVGLGRHPELIDVLVQVLLHGRPLCLGPGALQDTSFPCWGGRRVLHTLTSHWLGFLRGVSELMSIMMRLKKGTNCKMCVFMKQKNMLTLNSS